MKKSALMLKEMNKKPSISRDLPSPYPKEIDMTATLEALVRTVGAIYESENKKEIEIHRISKQTEVILKKLETDFMRDMTELRNKYFERQAYFEIIQKLIANAEARGDREMILELLEKWKELLIQNK